MIDWDALLPADPPAGPPAIAPQPAPTPESPSVDDGNTGNAASEREGDNRRRCTECGNLNERGLCLAAHRGEIVAGRSYTPIRDILRRCEGFKPMSTDPDQRPAGDRWGTIHTDTTAPATMSPAPIIANARGKNATL